MRLHNIGYLLKEGFKNVARNRMMSFACIGVLVACMLLIGGAAMVSLNVNAMVDFVEDQNEFVIVLEDWMSESDIAAMDSRLAGFENIASFEFVSRHQSLEDLIADAGDEAALYIDLRGEENPLPDRYIVSVSDIAYLSQTVRQLEAVHGIERVNYAGEVSDILVAVRRAVAYAGMVVVGILIVVSLVIITNNIKLTVFARRKEISIMKYVGATDAFIRMPFLVEGVIIGLSSAIIAFLVLGFGYTYMIGWIGEQFVGVGPLFERAVDFWLIAPYVFGAFAGLGVFVGLVGSGSYVRRYLKV
ncbi:MAG: permease-like cell division protein FtsX [Oscillospiraceae bacterium]|nr:permease-like cell division protein FtsX [Oscillospiraceae bacterium]